MSINDVYGPVTQGWCWGCGEHGLQLRTCTLCERQVCVFCQNRHRSCPTDRIEEDDL